MNDNEQLTDEQLMEQIQQEDEIAFSQLYDRYAPIVLGVVQKIVRDRTVAEEVMQETFWRVWSQANNFSPDRGKPTTWLFSIARRLAIDVLRRQKVRPQAPQNESVLLVMEQQPSSHNVSKSVDIKMQGEMVRLALQELPEEQKLVLEMAYFQGKTRREIATETNTPVGTIHTRARLGLKRMVQILNEYGVGST